MLSDRRRSIRGALAAAAAMRGPGLTLEGRGGDTRGGHHATRRARRDRHAPVVGLHAAGAALGYPRGVLLWLSQPNAPGPGVTRSSAPGGDPVQGPSPTAPLPPSPAQHPAASTQRGVHPTQRPKNFSRRRGPARRGGGEGKGRGRGGEREGRGEGRAGAVPPPGGSGATRSSRPGG